MADSKLLGNLFERKTHPRKYALPPIVCGFPSKRDDFFNLPENEQWMECLLKLSGMEKKVFREKACVISMIHYFYPFCRDVERFEILVKTFVASYLMDDILESSYADITKAKVDQNEPFQISELFVKLKNNIFVSTVKWDPYFFALNAALEATYVKYDQVQKERAINQWIFALKGFQMEREFNIEERMHSNIEEYNKIRVKSCGARVAYQSIEFADSIYIPDQLWEDLKIQTFIDLASLHMIYLNDIFSFEKEFNEVNDLNKMFNVVTVISVVEGLPIERSMEKAAQMLLVKEKEILELEDKISREENCLPVTKIFIERVKYICGGNYEYHRVCNRYHKKLLND